jgi:hypothetical protein
MTPEGCQIGIELALKSSMLIKGKNQVVKRMNKMSWKQPSKHSFLLTKHLMFSHIVILFENAHKSSDLSSDVVAYYREVCRGKSKANNQRSLDLFSNTITLCLDLYCE